MLHYYVSEIISTLLNQAFLPWRFGPHKDARTEGLVCVRLFSLSRSDCSIFVIITLPWGFNSHSAQRKLNYASFYPLSVVQFQSEGCEKLGWVPEKCSKLWYWILYFAVLLFRDILSDYIFVLQCYNCVWLKGGNISDPNIYDSQSESLLKAKGDGWPVYHCC